jgi:hypothetical protein
MPLRVLAPIVALLTGAFALYQLWVAGVALRLERWGFAVFYLVFGLAGLAVTTALWRLRRGLPGRPPEP